jgi:hypothetical protein
MKQRTPKQAQAAVDAAVDQVVKDGGVIHEESLWDAALDGVLTESIAERIRQERAEAYVPRGGWRART